MKTARALPILMYHHVSPNPGLVTVSPAIFREHIKALAESGWRSAGLDEVERFYRGEAIPAKTCVITFDDGYLDNYVHAHPVLKEFGMRAVLFVVTGWIGDGPARSGFVETPDHNVCKKMIAAGMSDLAVLRWSEINLMAEAGTFEFHCHTHTHTRWDQLGYEPTEKKAALAQDLERSKHELISHLGQCSAHLCWPQGYYDEDYISVAQEASFSHCYTTNRTLNLPLRNSLGIGRFVAKEAPGKWLLARCNIYSKPVLGKLYNAIRG